MIPPKIPSEHRLLRWGVLGAARINAKAVPALQGAARSKVLALASRDLGRARLQAGVLGVAQAFGDYEALLQDPTLDAIYISVPTVDHVHWARRALAAGKHVLVEKPLTLDPAEAHELFSAAQSRNLVLSEGFMYRYHPLFQQVEEILKSGALGPFVEIHGSFHFPMDMNDPSSGHRLNAASGGALGDVGCYLIDATTALLGHGPLQAQVAHARFNDGGALTEVRSTLTYPGDVTLKLHCGFHAARTYSLTLVGMGGALRVDALFKPLECPGLEFTLGSHRTVLEPAQGENPFVLQARHFEKMVLDGYAPVITPAQSLYNASALQGILRSAQTRRALDLPATAPIV
jgi:predicted dehydrogenase